MPSPTQDGLLETAKLHSCHPCPQRHFPGRPGPYQTDSSTSASLLFFLLQQRSRLSSYLGVIPPLVFGLESLLQCFLLFLSLFWHINLALPAAHWVIFSGSLHLLQKANPRILCSAAIARLPPQHLRRPDHPRTPLPSLPLHPSVTPACLLVLRFHQAALLKAPLIHTRFLILIFLDIEHRLTPLTFPSLLKYLLPLTLVLLCSQLSQLSQPVGVQPLSALPCLSLLLPFRSR